MFSTISTLKIEILIPLHLFGMLEINKQGNGGRIYSFRFWNDSFNQKNRDSLKLKT